MSDFDELDQLLHEAGRRWRGRASEAEFEPDPRSLSAFEAADRGRQRASLLVGAVAAIVVGAALVLSVPPTERPDSAANPGGSPSPSAVAAVTPTATTTAPPTALPRPRATPTPVGTDEVLREGDPVSAAGFVMGSNDDGFRICFPDGHILLTASIHPSPSPVTPRCPAMSVALLNVADDALPGTAIADGGKSDFLTVRGTWTGDAISVESAALRDPPGRFPWPPSPCDPPPGGWPGWIPMDLDGETALRILSEQLAEEPAVFTEFWVAYLDPSRPTETDVAVVGTVGNVQGATERLSAIFPYNLCIIQVEYSAADLAAIEHRVGPMDPAWMPGIDWPSNRVEIELPFVVHASIARVGTDRDAVVFRPIVVKAGN